MKQILEMRILAIIVQWNIIMNLILSILTFNLKITTMIAKWNVMIIQIKNAK